MKHIDFLYFILSYSLTLADCLECTCWTWFVQGNEAVLPCSISVDQKDSTWTGQPKRAWLAHNSQLCVTFSASRLLLPRSRFPWLWGLISTTADGIVNYRTAAFTIAGTGFKSFSVDNQWHDIYKLTSDTCHCMTTKVWTCLKCFTDDDDCVRWRSGLSINHMFLFQHFHLLSTIAVNQCYLTLQCPFHLGSVAWATL